MRIIGIDIVKGSTAVIHNLEPGWYPFGKYEKPNMDMPYEPQRWERPVDKLYQIYDRMPEVSVCAIVGNNGSRIRDQGGSGGQELLYTLSAQYIPSKIVIHA